MSKKIKSALSCILLLSLILVLVGCGSNASDNTNTIDVAQNDWAGGFIRLSNVQTDVMSITEVLDTQNYEIIMGNPTDYWNNEDYHYLHFVPCYDDTMALTYFFNEQEDFSNVQTKVSNYMSDSYNNVNSRKIDVNHYNLTYQTKLLDWETWQDKTAHISLELIYDANHMWMQLDSTAYFTSKETFNNCFYEFAELEDGIYAIQNEQERLYVVYDEEGNITEFYHSVLPDVTQEAASSYLEYIDYLKSNTSEQIEEISYVQCPIYQIEDDSIYLDLDVSGEDWVMERETFKSTVTYKDNILSVSVTNLLTNEIESFSVEVIEEVPEEGYIDGEEVIVEEVLPFNEQLSEYLQSIGLNINVPTWITPASTIGILIVFAIIFIVLYILRSIGRYYVFDQRGQSHPFFAWIPLLSAITLGFSAGDDNNEIELAMFKVPAKIIAFHPIICAVALLIPYAGIIISPLIGIVCKGSIYASIYTQIEGYEDGSKIGIGYLSAIVSLIPTIKFLIYRRNEY